MNKLVNNKFDKIAFKYDEQRKHLVPCYDDFYSIAVSMISTDLENPRILDLGSGTGLISFLLKKIYHNAEITLIDISKNMIDVAKARFKNYENITFVVGDYVNYIFDDKYDIIVSGLSIHHISNEDKIHLFSKIYRILNPHGQFVNADQVLGGTPFLDSLYKLRWKEHVEKSPLPAEEKAAWYDRIKLDDEAVLEDQLTWLKQIGFRDVDCVYKYYNFVVIYAKK
jgi:tRNA (cmo5U34)-methyltransferase